MGGVPSRSLRFTLVDIPMTMFGLVFTGINAMFLVNTFPIGLLIPHFWLGLYFLFGRFFVDAKIRQSTAYAITDTRVLVVRTWPTNRLHTLTLRSLPEVSLSRHRDGTSTIRIGSVSRTAAEVSWGRRSGVAFEFITDADHVMRLLHGQPPEDRQIEK